MATNLVDIDQVPPDIDPMAVGVINNPLKEDFTHAWAGKDITIPAESSKQFPLTVAVHLAKHLAEKIIRAEFRAGIAKIKDEKKRDIESAKAVPNNKLAIWVKMKELVETESDFFGGGEVEAKQKEQFIR